MTDKKISELNSLTSADVADADLLAIVDTSAGETKQITKSGFLDDLTIEDVSVYTHAIHPITVGENVGFFDGDPTYAGVAAQIMLQTAPGDGTGLISLYAQDASGHFVDISAFQDGNMVLSASHRVQGEVTSNNVGTNSLLVQDDGVDLRVDGSGENVTLQTGSIQIIGSGEIRMQATQIKIVLTSLPTSDPGVAGQLFTVGAPGVGSPKTLQVSGG